MCRAWHPVKEAAFLPVSSSSSTAAPLSLSPSPLLLLSPPLAVHPPPQLSYCLPLIRLHAARHKFIRGVKKKCVLRGLQIEKWFGLKESKTNEERIGKEDQGGMGGNGGASEGEERLAPAIGVPLPVPVRSKVYRGFNFTFPQPIRTRL